MCLGENWTEPTTFDGGNSLFDLSSIRGDQILVYCLGATAEPHFLWGFSFSGPWSPPNLTSYASNASALPDSLSDYGNVALEHCDNYIYKAPDNREDLNKTLLRMRFANPENYKCNDDMALALDERFIECGEAESASAPLPCMMTNCPYGPLSWLVTVGIVFLNTLWK